MLKRAITSVMDKSIKEQLSYVANVTILCNKCYIHTWQKS